MVSLREIPGYAIVLVVAGVALGIGGSILQSLVTGTATTTLGGNRTIDALNNATSGLSQLSTQLPNLGLVLGLAAILLVLMGVLAMFSGGQKRSR